MKDLIKRVHEQTDAFNAKDVGKLVANLADDYESYEIGPGGPELRATGKASVEQALTAMFAATGYASSELEDVRAYGNIAVALEIDTYDTGDGRRTLRNLGVYEYRGDKLARAYSFPIQD